MRSALFMIGLSACVACGAPQVRGDDDLSESIRQFNDGVRWERFPLGTRAGRGMEIYNTQTNQMMICGRGNTPEDCGIGISNKYFSPRLGLAYRASNTFVIRAGYGLNYEPNPFAFVRNAVGNYPEIIGYTAPVASTFTPAGLLRDGVPVYPVPDWNAGIVDLKRIAAEAEVDLVLTGTILRAGDQLGVSTQLVEASTGRLIWSRSSTNPMGDIFRLQDDLVNRTVESLALPLAEREHHTVRSDMSASMPA